MPKSHVSLFDVMICLAAAGLTAVLLPSCAHTHGTRKYCADNLGVISKALSQYSTDYDHSYPCESPGIAGYSYVGTARTLMGNPPTVPGHSGGMVTAQAGVSRALYLLVLHKYASTSNFVCPGVPDHRRDDRPPPGTTYFDFRDHKSLSYSYQVMKLGATGRISRLWLGSNPDIAILADRNPISGVDGWSGDHAVPIPDPGNRKRSGYDEFDRNSFNHAQEGQHVVNIDTSIRWMDTPYCGAPDTSRTPNVADNIWTPRFASTAAPGFVADSSPDAAPETPDSFLWP